MRLGITSAIENNKETRLAFFVAVFVTFITLLCAFGLWAEIKKQENNAIKTAFNEEVAQLSITLSSNLNFGVSSFQRMAQRWDQSNGTPYEQWKSNVASYLEAFPALDSMGWVDQDLKIRWVEPMEGNEAALGRSIDFDSPRREAYQLAREKNRPTITPPIDLVHKGRGIIIYTPLWIEGEPSGYLTSVYSTEQFMKSELWQNLLQKINLRLMDGDQILFSDDQDHIGNSEWEREVTISALNREWTLVVSPKQSLINNNYRHLSNITLLAGLLISLLAGFATYSALHSRLKNAQLLEQTQSLQMREKEKDELVDKLAASNEELTRFAYICSHDLQEPLRMIRSFSQRLQMHLGDNLTTDPKGQKYFRFITDGAERAQLLIQDILSYSQIDQATEPLEKVDLNDLVKMIAQNAQDYGDSSDRTIVTFDELPVIQGNKTQLYQLFQNLINNGLKYQKPDNIAKVHVSAINLGGAWEIAVIDNGIGIAPEYQNQIFTVFKRLHRRTEYAGTGVGLAICKKVVERHGGEIWIKSEEGQGSTFAFTLPQRTRSSVQTQSRMAA